MTEAAGNVVLAGDVGGTNARIALVRTDARRILHEARYASRAWDGLAPIVRAFLEEVQERPERACLGVACPVRSGRCRATNLPWRLDERKLAEAIGIGRTRLVNDFAAVGHGLEGLGPEDSVEIKPGKAEPGGVIALIGPGTGLGQAFVVRIDGRMHVFASEGGHATFAPGDEQGWALARHLRERYGHVSWERVASGPGIVGIYRWLAGTADGVNPEVERAMDGEDDAAVVTRFALADRDPMCVRALDMFVAALGAEAGNLALKVGATGGVYVAGGIAPRIVERLGAGDFAHAFTAKGRLEEYLAAVPVRVITDASVGLFGAARLAARL